MIGGNVSMARKNICILPWIHLHAHATGRTYPCCMADYDFVVGNTKEETFTEIWNGERMKELRLTMLADEQHSACSKCFDIEKVGGTSMRMTMNEEYVHKWGNVETTNTDGSVDKVEMAYMDIRFSNICNFKCRTCGPDFSSMWKDDWDKLYNGKWERVTKVKEDIDALWEDIDTWIDTVEHIYFAGGEPLLMDEHYLILDYLIKNNKTDIDLSYNTNLSKLKYKSTEVIDLWKNFKNVSIDASLDGYGKQAEYVRSGTDWNQIEENLNRIKSEVPHVKVSISSTVSAYNAYHILDFFGYCLDNDWVTTDRIKINMVQHPEHLGVKILPKDFSTRVKQRITDYVNEYDIQKDSKHYAELETFRNFLTSEKIDKFEEFLEWTEKLDAIRSEKVTDVIPEIKDIMNERRFNNEAICAAPWTHYYLQPNGNMHPCCTAQEINYGNTNEMSLRDAWTSDTAREFRQNLLDGKKQKACQFCYSQEKNTGMSLRTSLNSRYRHLITEDIEPDFNIKYLDVRSSNTCNMACVMCFHDVSSSWYDDGKALDPDRYKNVSKFIEIRNETEAQVLESIGAELDVLYFAGGEPLITPYHYTMLDYLIEKGYAKNIRLEYNTNLSTLKYKKRDLFDIWKHFKHVEIRASVDAHGEYAEYQRYGTDWNAIINNWKRVLEHPEIVIRPQITVTSLSIGNFPEFLDVLTDELDCKLDFDRQIDTLVTNIAISPEMMSMQHLPKEIKEQYIEKLNNYCKKNNPLTTPIVKRCISFMRDNEADLQQFHNMLEFLTVLDKRRKNDWRKLWPEFIPYYNNGEN